MQPFKLLIALWLVSYVLGQAVGPYPQYAANLEWFNLNGKTADPCANREDLGYSSDYYDCTGTTWPDSANTVLLASAASGGAAVTLTITGRNLPTTVSLRLAEPGQDCGSIVSGDLTDAMTLTSDGSTGTFTTNTNAHLNIYEVQAAPRKLCYLRTVKPGWTYTGFKVGVVWNCNDAAAATQCSNINSAATITSYETSNIFLSAQELAIRLTRSTCCRHSVNSIGTTYAVGQCIIPTTQSCCGGAAVVNIDQKCCDSNIELVQYKTRPCFCRTDSAPASPSCPTGETCCTFSKYDELVGLHTTTTTSKWPQTFGECYNSSTHSCCDTGYRYDPGVDQCCTINGIQSLNVPCPCNQDADCSGGQTPTANRFAYGTDNSMYCCMQQWPLTYEFADYVIQKPGAPTTALLRCNKYNNFPSTSFPNFNYPMGTGPYQAQRCLGQCINNQFQTCCNGVACRKEFEMCCNNTCCNKITSTCTEGYLSGTNVPRSRGATANTNEIFQPYEICTSIEALNPIRGFWVFVWPAYLLLMTLVIVAFSVAFINKVSRRSFSFLERSMMTIAFFTIIFGCACYFSTLYKYGVWIAIVNTFTIIVACSRSKGLNLALVIVQFITLLYLFDPFNGNNYFGFASSRVASGDPDPETAGILYSIYKNFHSLETFKSQRYCSQYYNYFNKDPVLMDNRFLNTEIPSFGYCGHGWLTALFIFEGFTLMLSLIQFILDLIAYILRFKEERREEIITLEQEEVMPAYAAAPTY